MIQYVFINWAFLSKIITMVNGVTLVILTPILLSTDKLAEFYVLYSVMGLVSVADMGLCGYIFNRGYGCKNTGNENKIRKMFFTRALFSVLIYFLYTEYYLELEQGVIYFLIGLLVIPMMLFYYVFLSYTEGNVNNKIAYNIRSVSEVVSWLFGTVALYIYRDPATIIAVIFGIKASIPLLYIPFFQKHLSIEIQPVKTIEKSFIFKTGVTSLFGYVCGIGSMSLLSKFFDTAFVTAYGQCYIIVSAMFSLTMSGYLYRQNTLRSL